MFLYMFRNNYIVHEVMAIIGAVRVWIQGHTFHLLFDYRFRLPDGKSDQDLDGPTLLHCHRRSGGSLGECVCLSHLGWRAIAQGAC